MSEYDPLCPLCGKAPIIWVGPTSFQCEECGETCTADNRDVMIQKLFTALAEKEVENEGLRARVAELESKLHDRRIVIEAMQAGRERAATEWLHENAALRAELNAARAEATLNADAAKALEGMERLNVNCGCHIHYELDIRQRHTEVTAWLFKGGRWTIYKTWQGSSVLAAVNAALRDAGKEE